MVEGALTCCLLVRATAFARAGLMDEAYFMYFDDSDFCGRLLRAGGRIAYVPEAVVQHDVQASSRIRTKGPNHFVVYYSTRNRPRFISRNVPGLGVRLVAHGFTIGTRLVRMAQSALRGDLETTRVIWSALVDGYLHGLTGATYAPPRR
jgi:GT2 family glycosyltransferase